MLLRSFEEAIDSLLANRLRALLTILGIVIGVGAVIAMLSLGSGVQETVTGQISGIGSNLLFVIPGNRTEEVRNAKPLTLQDANALRDVFAAPSVAIVAPVLQTGIDAIANGNDINTTLVGATPDYALARSLELVEGEFFTDEQQLGRASVVVIGPETAEKLFDRREGVVGETIRLDGQPFRVVGLLESRGGGAMGSEDDVAIVPLSSAQSRFTRRKNQDQVDLIYVQAVSAELVSQASEEVSQILRSRHRIMFGVDDFTVFSQEDFVDMANMITNVLTIFLGGVAGISLLVGGIGIMNIMLVSVTERTREIGLRKALGAKKLDILVQFLAESALLSMLGGIIGIGLGWLLSMLVGRIAEANGVDLVPIIGLDSILLATLFSAAVGIFFGIYPANRAASLEPVEALRHD
jgi:putative ABC transport system permease protein